MFFPSTLVIAIDNATLDKQTNLLLANLGHTSIQNNPDIFILSQKEDYSVENIRQIKKFLSQVPYSHPNKIVIIPQADLLNLESQNTLLKSLEEPGPDNYFILSTTKPNHLIPTILSRCHFIRLKSSTISSHPAVKFPSSINESLILADDLAKDKASVLPYLEQQLQTHQRLLAQNPDQVLAHKINKIIKTIQLLNANVDPKTAIDFLFLS